jgi:hypothetical protein
MWPVRNITYVSGRSVFVQKYRELLNIYRFIEPAKSIDARPDPSRRSLKPCGGRLMCEVHALIALAVCAAVLGFAIGIPCGVALAQRRG